jgi:cyclohexanone monooxygenase
LDVTPKPGLNFLSAFGLPFYKMTPKNMLAAFEELDHEKMSEIRSRVDTVVEDEQTAQQLKAWYRQLCKRPCFHDEYLAAYNEPGTVLVDTDGKGAERVTKNGVVVGSEEYELDCIVYASGFEVGTDQTSRNGFDVTGRDGLKLSEAWEGGMRSLHGIHVHGFPNLFILGAFQGAALISNVPHNFTESGRTIAMMIRHAMDKGAKEVEVERKAEEAWLKLLGRGRGARARMGSMLSKCTPGYYNNEGQEGGLAAQAMGYPRGPVAFFKYLKKWRNSGRFEGLEFR